MEIYEQVILALLLAILTLIISIIIVITKVETNVNIIVKDIDKVKETTNNLNGKIFGYYSAVEDLKRWTNDGFGKK